MNEKYSEKEIERLNNLKNDLIIHFHQDAAFYERRTYIIFFIISGFGLYTCLDLYKNVEENYLLILSISTGLFLLPLLLSIVSNELARKKSIYKAEYFQSTDDLDREGAGKYIKLENGFKLVIGSCYLIGAILLGIVYYLNFPLS
ncbi:hypothetical protein [uncultured Aquimarina sp.]|uniref:hypothetical protein n=1 Tax=uncultured Aquimarina sp. TaxID=575652 RepID=UPI002619A68C|nr:hypothetical protein [uncultured Aquimarina sp.]